MDMPVSVGVEHRKAPERLPDAAETPWELRVSRRSAGLRAGERPWVAGPTCLGVCESPCPDAEGSSERGDEPGRKPWRRRGDDVLRRGFAGSGTTAVEPGRRGLKRLGVLGAFDLVFLRVRGCIAPGMNGSSGSLGAAMRQGGTARPSERVSRAKTPRAAADLACPQGRRGINPSRGRETPRTEGVGPGGPRQADPSADVAEGARNLRRGDPVRQDRGGRIGLNPERETKPGSR